MDTSRHAFDCDLLAVSGGMNEEGIAPDAARHCVRMTSHARKVLLEVAAYIMCSLRFVLRPGKGHPPARLFLHHSLARRHLLRHSCEIDLRSHPAGAPLKREFTCGCVYSAGRAVEARLAARGLQQRYAWLLRWG